MSVALALDLFIGFVSGIISVLFVRRFTNRAKLRTTTNKAIAHLLEIRLFSDDPAQVLRSQWQFLQANFRALAIIALPLLLITPIVWLLFAGAEKLVSESPLKPGDSTVVTLQWKSQIEPVKMSVPNGFTVSAPVVRVAADKQTCWRVTVDKPANAELGFQIDGRQLRKAIRAAAGLGAIERPLSDPEAASIRLQYPTAMILGMRWWVWFVVGSFAGFAAGARFRIDSRRSAYGNLQS